METKKKRVRVRVRESFWKGHVFPGLLREIYTDTKLYQRFRSFKVDRPGPVLMRSEAGNEPQVSLIGRKAPWFPRTKAG